MRGRICLKVFLATTLTFACQAGAASLDPELSAAMQAAAPGDHLSVIIRLAGRYDLKSFEGLGRKQRRRHVRLLREDHERRQAGLDTRLLAKQGKGIRRLWSINGLSVSLPVERIAELASLPEVESMRLDARVRLPDSNPGLAGPVEWNLDAVGVPALWARGYSGTGMVVANMDSGVDYQHPDLTSRWRGGSNSWFDPSGQHALPFDALGHGTQTMGLMVGGNAGGSQIGVAPNARWIAVKIFDDNGYTTLSRIHEGFQWLLDPDGNPATDDQPDVVNNSWGFQTNVNQCNLEFNSDLQVLKAAGIAVVFSAGNAGPGYQTSVSPANNPAGLATGALDQANAIAGFSSQGPSACDGSVFADLVAPGVNVRSSDLSLGGTARYASVSGTSFASPHVAGIMALLAEAFPDAGVTEIEAALAGSAQDLGLAGPDNVYGNGLVNAGAAHDYLASQGSSGRQATVPPAANRPPVARDDIFTVQAGSSLVTTAPGVQANDSDPDGDPLVSEVLTRPLKGHLNLAPDGGFNYTPRQGFVGKDSFTYRLSDGSQEGVAMAAITVTELPPLAGVNQAPIARDDQVTVEPRQAMVIDVLANDSDAEGALDPGSIRLVKAPSAGGRVRIQPDGRLAYRPGHKQPTQERFSYRVRDRHAAWSNTAVVTVVMKAHHPHPPEGDEKWQHD